MKNMDIFDSGFFSHVYAERMIQETLRKYKDKIPYEANQMFHYDDGKSVVHVVNGKVYISIGSLTRVFFYSDYRG